MNEPDFIKTVLHLARDTLIRQFDNSGALSPRQHVTLERIDALLAQYPEPEPSVIDYAIGDLGVARRHVHRLQSGAVPFLPMVLTEISASIERCVTRLESVQ